MQDGIPRKLLTLAGLALLLPAAGAAAAEKTPELSPKGIYHAVDEHQRTGIKFHAELKERGKKARRVPVTHDFRTGDRFTFTFEINRDGYVYVINQTLEDADTLASGLKSKRIDRVYVNVTPPPARPPRPPASTPPPAPAYLGQPRLLFPTYKAGSNNRLRSDKPHALPTRGHYAMDEVAGIERIYVVISDRRLDLRDYFYSDSGRSRSPDAADRLRRQLTEWKANAEVELVAKGVVHEVASYGVSIDPAKPAVVEIDLGHRP